ncbi:hypothetical protein I302_100296 [Kwoniella bestiolae CBS 10118]|uniref:Uncharacterized protein n=1 Tax=Kwoniella bestiolae CBS 10118 TaxID=1296100 RepID=A0AAJ8JZW8_9TREE
MPPPPTGVRPAISKPVPKPSKIRYFKGKAPDAPPSDSDSDEDDDGQQQQHQQIKKRHEATQIDRNYVAGGAGRVIMPGGGVKMELGSVKVGGTKMPLGKDGGVKEESSEEETDEESEEETKPGAEESSEYETDSEEESEPEPPKPVFRPNLPSVKRRR